MLKIRNNWGIGVERHRVGDLGRLFEEVRGVDGLLGDEDTVCDADELHV